MVIAVSLSCRNDREWQDCLNQSYVDFVLGCGCTPLLVPNVLRSVPRYVEEFGATGVLLTGGHDCTEKVDGVLDRHSSGRDRTERELLDWAVRHSLPVIGVCRGFHFLNVFYGGRVTFADGIDAAPRKSHVALVHPIELMDPMLQTCFAADRIEVNSFHNNVVRPNDVAPAFSCTATCIRDGVVEAVRHHALPVYGVQWHPERPGGDSLGNVRMLRLFLGLEDCGGAVSA